MSDPGRAGVPRRIAFLGFGLIGGSIARAIRTMDGASPALVAWSPSGTGPARALADGVLDAAATSPARCVEGADLVVIAAPPLETLDVIDALGGALASALDPNATVTDVASTKGAVVARADAADLRFVGGHPMAGRETSGYGAADPDLFEGRPWVVVPGARSTPRDVTRVGWLALGCRARPVQLDAAAHDAAAAGVSHLPLVLAAALVEAVAGDGGVERDGWSTAAGLAASGWRDMTRLARGDVAMGAGILATNGPAVASRLRDYRAVIDGWLAELDARPGPDAARIGARLAAARQRLA